MVQAGTALQEEPLDERCLERDNRRIQNVKNGKFDHDLKEHLCLRMKRTSEDNSAETGIRILYCTVGHE
jgi:hypothetical protein